MLVFVMVFAFCFQVLMWLMCLPREAIHWGLHCCNPLGNTLGRHICLIDLWPIPGVHQVAAAPLLWVGGVYCHSSSSSPTIQSIWWSIQYWRPCRVTQSLHLPYLAEKSLLFQVLYPPITHSTQNL